MKLSFQDDIFELKFSFHLNELKIIYNRQLTIVLRKTVFYSIQYKNLLKRSFTASDRFPMFTQSINFYIFYCHIIKEYRQMKNVTHQIDRNEWLLLQSFSISARFTAKFELVFVLTQENAFSWWFHFKVGRKSIGIFTRDF